MNAPHVLLFRAIGLGDVPRVGGKNASIGELIANLSPLGVRVPDGFAITADAFRLHLREARIDEEIYAALDRLDVRDVDALAKVARGVRERVRSAPLPADLSREISDAYEALSRAFHEVDTDVAVRSSATAEDLPEASFAGQHESYLHVRGRDDLLRAVRACMASLFSDRAIVYRAERGYSHRDVALSVGVQKMVRSDLAGAGVIFTLDPESGCRDVVVITAAFGLGEMVVQGRVDPDEVWVHKPTLRAGFRSIVRRDVGEKEVELVYSDGASGLVERSVSAGRRRRLVLDDDELLLLARWSMAIEDHYARRAGRETPMDLEWAKDGRTGDLFVVQARPETVQSRVRTPKIEFFEPRGRSEVLARGKSVGAKIGAGVVRVVPSKEALDTFGDGEVLVAPSTDPDWQPILKRAAAVVTDHGGRTCHAAIVSRELGIPCVVGTGDATRVLKTGDVVTVSCAEGEEGRVYAGALEYARRELDLAAMAKPRVPVMLNVADPETAFAIGRLPSAGVGLVRIEFVVSSWIGVHPMALLHPERVDASARAAIATRIDGARSGSAFFVDRLASGVAQIAAAFYPRPVIVRFSDFKTNEYAGLLGGTPFEPVEDNPMIGFRGASRYYDARYREAFALECEALRKVRAELGLKNVIPMIPFCRTLGEARAVLAEMAKNGLVRGEDGLEVYVMCEIPNNVVLASDFSDLFDGFSIGSNDLTQLTLGIDRDSDLLAHLFDEEDPGVKAMIAQVIAAAHAKGRKVGLCGQAPSDKPAFAAFLAAAGIDSISVTPDAFARVVEVLGGGAS